MCGDDIRGVLDETVTISKTGVAVITVSRKTNHKHTRLGIILCVTDAEAIELHYYFLITDTNSHAPIHLIRTNTHTHCVRARYSTTVLYL